MKQNLFSLVNYIEDAKNFVLFTNEGIENESEGVKLIYYVSVHFADDKIAGWNLDKDEYYKLENFFKTIKTWKIKSYKNKYGFSSKHVGISNRATSFDIEELKAGYYSSYALFAEETRAADIAAEEKRQGKLLLSGRI